MPSRMGQEVRLSLTRHPHLHLLNISLERTSIPPAIHIASGDTVSFTCLDASNGQITPSSSSSAISSLVFSQLDQVNGPVFVQGALPEDTLKVDILEIETSEWGWTGIIPGFGLLKDEFREPGLVIWEIEKREGEGYAVVKSGGEGGLEKVMIPIRPFAGEMGVARGLEGPFSTIPPYNTGVS